MKENELKINELILLMIHYDNVNNQETYMCRICLEEDSVNNLIYPCKCSGGSKYIHKECLNEWRTTSENRDNMDRCECCHYEYKFKRINDMYESKFSKFCKCFVNAPFLFYAMYVGLSILIGQFIYFLDNGNVIQKVYVIGEDTISPLYYIFGASVIFFTQILIILKWFFRVKNKKLYCNLYKFSTSNLGSLAIFLIVFYLWFGWMVCLLCIQIAGLLLFRKHFHCIEQLNSLNKLEIINYEPDIEQTDDVPEQKEPESNTI